MNEMHIMIFGQFQGTKVDFMDSMFTKPSWKNQPSTRLTGIPVLQVSKESHFPAGQEL